MRIRKFNENDVSDISNDRSEEIIQTLSDLANYVNEKKEVIDSLINELDDFRSPKNNKNDQIDDSISNLQLLRGCLSDSVDKIDNVVINIKDYNKSGRKYLY